MPRPTRTRAASKRAAPIAKDPSPAPQQISDSIDIQDTTGREIETQPARRTSGRTTRTKAIPNPRQAAELAATRERRDAALSRLENITSTSTNANTAEEDTESSIEVELGRRAVAATPAHAGRLNDLSGLDLDDSMFDDLNTTIDTAGPASAQRSFDTSTLSASNFKRRPRAGSFLSRDDGPLRPSSRAGPNTPGISSTFNIGVFKRRAREPSILGTAQKPRAERPVPQSENGDKSDEEEDDEAEDEEPEEEPAAGNEFSPEAESTPLRRSKRRSGAAVIENETAETSTSTNTRKRKSTEAHQQRVRSSPYGIEDNPMAAEDSEEDTLSSPPSLPPMRRRPSTPFRGENIAPPESSGSESEAEVWPPLQSLAKGRSRRAPPPLRRTPERDVALDDNPSDLSSPPSLTYSPNYGNPSPPPAKQTRAASKPVTTADLTGLLPRRRQRNAKNDPFGAGDSEDEVDNTGLGNEDDELSYLDVGTRRRPTRALSRAGASNQTDARGKSAQRKGKGPGSSKPARTYGRSSDKENQEEEAIDQDVDAERNDDASENSEQLVARVGDELKKAARKFAEVDKWELEFEERIQSSSPRDAR